MKQSSEQVLFCFSHLRWQFVLQRPQHVMTRLAARCSVIFWEEPLDTAEAHHEATLDRYECPASGVVVLTPRLPESLQGEARDEALRQLLDGAIAKEADGKALIRWFYTPMMLPLARHLTAACTVYDCMDELSKFRFAPEELLELEAELLGRSDVVFTGGYSLYEAKRDRHANVHVFPSSVDTAHFGQARGALPRPADQGTGSGPRLGFFGVIDERLDYELVAHLADAHPEWQLTMVGPVVKVDEADLPRRPNLHWVGPKPYAELPQYLASWDVALMPFALNESTEFISPTKTPEYLAGGIPVVSTPINDVIRQYGALRRLSIGRNPSEFLHACEGALRLGPTEGLVEADALLATMSWDDTVARMHQLLHEIVSAQKSAPRLSRAVARRPRYDCLVVGAGFAGSVMAERLARGSNQRVLVIDKRPHVAGNAYDERDAAGVLIHKYGPHIFHTSSEMVVDYLSQFTEWRPYEHRVLAVARDQTVPIPINRTTLNAVFGLSLQTDADAAAFLASRAEPVHPIRTAEDVVVSQVGRELYELFFRGYTRKQWGKDPSELDRSVTARIPTRTCTDDRYFGDRFQAMPKHGYTRMFESMLSHPGIDVRLGVDWAEVREQVQFDRLVFTGPVDEYFGYRHGALPYRSLSFRHETLDTEWHQAVAVVNYPSPDVPYTRVSEYKHLTGQSHPKTSITYEYPSDQGDPYYPIPCPETQLLYRRYEALAAAEQQVTFVGRLATYRYYNMDQVVAQALTAYRKLSVSHDEPMLASQSA